jgi:RecA-family ATPase
LRALSRLTVSTANWSPGTSISIRAARIRSFSPKADHLIAVIKELGIKAMIVDPFVSTHAIQENNNAAIDKVSKLWARIADEADCAIHLVHHTRKTGREELTAESVRGA